MVATIPQDNLLLIVSKMQFWSVAFVPKFNICMSLLFNNFNYSIILVSYK
jgi:hypothetical protein